MASFFGENSTIVKTYKYLVNQAIMLGSSIDNPLITKNASQSLDNAYIMNISKTVLTEAIIFTIKNTDEYKKIKFKTFTFATDGNKSVEFKLYLNGSTGGTFESWSGDSVAEVSTTATLSLTTSTIGGITKIDEQIGGTILAKIANDRIDLSGGDVEISLNQNETLTVTAQSTNSNETKTLVRWVEER